MDPLVLVLASHFISVTSPTGQMLDVAADQIVSLRPKSNDEHFANEARCLIHTTDGKFIAVRETCKEVEDKLNEIYQSRESE